MVDPDITQPDPRWSTFMTSPIPPYLSVCEIVVARCTCSADVDGKRLRQAVADAMWERLQELTYNRTDVAWAGLADLRTVPDPNHRHLTAYLSTHGAVGLALIDKLRSYLLYVLPRLLVDAVERGMFDVCDVRAAREP
ncbi:hypothetical protein D8W71_21780 [Rhodococcus sp. P1Y]|nr:hypothetical protein D8W71_21780 [Rhodococcus sp. P1Y]